jgi:endonuclease/exonuclease/phosphatase family metal-dependent hydrolase
MRLRIATLNCLNLGLPGRRLYDGVEPYSADEYIAKTQWVASMLDRLAADVVLLQEVFHEQALSDAVRQSADGARRWAMAAPGAGPNNVKPRLALVWRRPLQPRITSIAAFPPGCAVPLPEAGEHASFSRPLLRADLELPGLHRTAALILVNVHLKSRRPDFAAGERADDAGETARARLRSLIKRGAEAAALRSILDHAMAVAPAPIVVGGDFNDRIDAVTTRLVSEAAPGFGGEREAALELFDAFEVLTRLPAGQGGRVPLTIVDGALAERIDHILVSKDFVAGSPGALGRVARIEVLLDHLQERQRMTVEGEAPFSRIYSDHAGVCVTLETLS